MVDQVVDCNAEISFLGTSLKSKVFVVAEIGVNHEGSVDVAADIIKQLVGTGVDAVKLQSYSPQKFVSSEQIERLDRIKRFQLSFEEHVYLRDLAKDLGLKFISTPVTEDWVSPLSEICDGLKIASGDIDFSSTIQACARTGLPTILSTGASTVSEVDTAVEFFTANSAADSMRGNLALLHCVSEYPADPSVCNLNSIGFLKARYGIEVGWSNHALGSYVSELAVMAGASIIELHVTDNKSNRAFRDHHLSFEPEELAPLVSRLNYVKKIAGTKSKTRTAVEESTFMSIRKGLVYNRSMQAGTVLKASDISFARPATYYASSKKHSLVGCILSKDVTAFHSIRPSELQVKKKVKN
ncbi:N-acetylneuraminate synthase family protein [Alphaproteobacteria bacterium]|nr:N-acetylneuraminate synthase family protein [Alphaproteobacteria bacterium]